MHISKRIQAIVDMVSPGHAVCDVGCDHAYTSIALTLNEKCPFAVASDVRPGPLAAAAQNIKAAGLNEVIDVCLADGVPEDVHKRLPEGKKTLVITGMGGMLILQILERAGETAAFDEMVLSPQSDIDLVRRKLEDMGFAIADEEMLIDEGKFYTVMRAVRDGFERKPGEEERNLSKQEGPGQEESEEPAFGKGMEPEKGNAALRAEAEILYGPVLLGRRHPVLREYLEKQERTLKAIRDNLEKSGRNEDDERVREVIRKMEVLREAQRYYEGH